MYGDIKQNPYAPLAVGAKAPQIAGSPHSITPVQMKKDMTMEQQLGSIASQAVSDKVDSMIKDPLKEGFKDSLRKTTMGYGSNLAQAKGLMEVGAASAGGTLSPLAAQAVIGSGSQVAPVVAKAAGTTGASLGGAAGKGAAALGPVGIPLLIGGALYAASRRK